MNLSIFVIILSVIIIVTHMHLAVAEPVGSKLGVISDAVFEDNTLYFFETYKEIKSSMFIHDTRIMKYDGKVISRASDELFMYPTEIHATGDYLYLAVLSDSCAGQIICDYQDVVKISKKNGSKITLFEHLKSAIHISTDDDRLYISESSGNIWTVSNDNELEKELVFNTDNIVMDITSDDDTVYWVEEIEDLNNKILSIKQGQEPKIISENLKLPYDLQSDDNSLQWKEISIKPIDGSISEFTTITAFINNELNVMGEFENTSPISTKSIRPHYEPFLVKDNFILLANNTLKDSTLQLLDTKNSTKYDIAKITSYDVKFLRTGNNFVYVIGANEEGFIIEKFSLPVTIPEFSSNLLFFVVIISLALTISLKRFVHHGILLKI